MAKTRVALFGTGFIANIHMESYNRFVHDAEVVAVYGRNPEKPRPEVDVRGGTLLCAQIRARAGDGKSRSCGRRVYAETGGKARWSAQPVVL